VPTLDGLEVETVAALDIAHRLLKDVMARIEVAQDRVAIALDALEREHERFTVLIAAIAEGQRRLARIRDVRAEVEG